MNSGERSKRRKRELPDKAEAFEKLKQLKTNKSKNKYEIKPLQPVYEEVSEMEYTEMVLKRQRDDWIVGDTNGADCYVENGEEIFDDDINEIIHTKEREHKRRGKKQNTNDRKTAGGIEKMLSNMPVKKRQPDVKLEDTDVVSSLMDELDSLTSTDATVNTSCSLFDDTSIISNSGHCTYEGNHSFNLFNEYDDLQQSSGNADVKAEIADVKDIAHIKSESVDVTDIINVKLEPFDDMKLNIPEDRNIEVKETNLKMENVEVKIEDLDDWGVNFQDKIMGEIDKAEAEEQNVTKVCESSSIKFFYWDAYEDFFNQPGQIFLFGKVWSESSKSYVSCCLIVKDIERRIFLLPREHYKQRIEEPVSMRDVYEEFSDKVSNRYKIMKFRTKQVNKMYAFNMRDVPSSAEYLEVRYSARYPYLPNDLEGETFSHVFGTTTSFLEHFLLDRKIKGPCWLEIKNANFITDNGRVSWCKMEMVCSNYEEVMVLHDYVNPPPLTILTVNMRTTILPKTNENFILMIGYSTHTKFSVNKDPPNPPFESRFCGFTRSKDITFPLDLEDALKRYTSVELKKINSESELLSCFLDRLATIDPDLIVGHDVYTFEMGALVHRLIANKIPNWSRIGRLRKKNTSFTKNYTYLGRIATSGRLLCDTKISAKELIKARSYELSNLCEQVLHINEKNFITIEQPKLMYRTAPSLILLIKSTIQEVEYITRIMYQLNIIPLSLQITNIAGNVLSRTLTGGRSERNEFLLLHAFNDRNYIVPDKAIRTKTKTDGEENESKGKSKGQYKGGLVLDPKKGYYDKMILLLDFNSLYPSIIQEFNICFTTIPVRLINFIDGNELDLMNHIQLSERGVLPTEIRKLVESRCEVKTLLKQSNISPALRNQYNIRQLALKLTANSMYGCLGFSNSRFYAKPLAALITAKGREILLNTRDLVQRLNFDVIYGDTDSLMINTNSVDYDQVFKYGCKIKDEVNKMYKRIELEVDGIFKYMLLLKKKKYAAVSVTKLPNGEFQMKQQMVGLDIVRRDWSPLTAEAGKYVLSQILSDKDIDEKIQNIHRKLRELKESLENNKIPIAMLVITKQLTKNPDEYPDKSNLPHVQVALRLNHTMSKKLKRGDTVPYVICTDGTDLPATKRAYHEEEMKQNSQLNIDFNYYLSQQIHPVISRLCEPIDGTDGAQIAECLGLDSSSYKQSKLCDLEGDPLTEECINDEEEKFKHCEKFQFNCIGDCAALNILDIPRVQSDGSVIGLLDQCSNSRCDISILQKLPYLENTLTLNIRSYVKKYYQNFMMCVDITCSNNTRRLSLKSKIETSICDQCRKNRLVRSYTEFQLYNQLRYFQNVFDLTQAIHNIKTLRVDHESDIFLVYSKLKEQVENALNLSAYSRINFETLAERMMLQTVTHKVKNTHI